MPTAPVKVPTSGPSPSDVSKKEVSLFEQQWSVNNPVLLYHSGNSVVEYIGSGGETVFHTATVRSNLPLEVVGFRQAFGLSIESLGDKGYIALGVCNSSYSTSSFPGWHYCSVGFHADVGDLMDHTQYDRQKSYHVSASCSVGDVLSCSVHEHPSQHHLVVVVFGKNGYEMGRVTMELPKDGLFAVIGMMSFGERVKLHPDVPSLPGVVREMNVFRSLGPMPDDIHSGFLSDSSTSTPLAFNSDTTPMLSSADPEIQTHPGVDQIIQHGRYLESPTKCLQDTLPWPGLAATSDALLQSFSVQNGIQFVESLQPGYHTFKYSNPPVTSPQKVGSVVSRHSLSMKTNYFEVILEEWSGDAAIRVGVVGGNYTPDCLPGDVEHSVGFQPDIGGLFVDGQMVVRATSNFDAGDVIGIDFDQQSLGKPQYHHGNRNTYSSTSDVLATVYRNSKLLCRVTCPVPIGGVFPAVGVSESYAKFTIIHSYGVSHKTYFSRHRVPKGHLNLELCHASRREMWSHVQNVSITDGCVIEVVESKEEATLCSDRLITPQSSYFEVKTAYIDSLSLSLVSSVEAKHDAYSWFPHLGELRSNSAVVKSLPLNLKALDGVDTVNIGMGVDFCSQDAGTADLFVTFQQVEIGRITLSTQQNWFPCVRIYPAKMPAVGIIVRYPVKWPPALYYGHGMRRGSQYISSEVEHIFRYSGNGTQDEMGVVQSAVPLSVTHPYYEVNVISPGMEGYIGVGLAHVNYPLTWQPGWGPGSIGLHTDDGQLFHGPQVTLNIIPPCPYKSTVIGCGVVFPPEESSSVVEVYFTVNGRLVVRQLSIMPEMGYFPTIGMNSLESVVEVSRPCKRAHPQLSSFSYSWHYFPSDCDITQLPRIPSLENAPLSPSSELNLKLNLPFVSHSTYNAHVGDYFEVSPVSSQLPRLMAGYILSSASPITCTSCDFSFLVDFSKGIVMCDGIEVSTGIISDALEHSSVGIGLQQIEQQSLFFVSLNTQLVYCHPVSSGLIRYHRVITTPVEEIPVRVDCSKLWPPVSPAGIGWSKAYNTVCYRGTNLTPVKPSLAYVQGASPLIPEVGEYFEVAVVGGDKNMKFDIGVATHGFALDSDSKKGKYQLKHRKGSEFVSFQSEGRIHGKWKLQNTAGTLPRVAIGDTVGCGLMSNSTSSERIAYITHNGHIVAYGPLSTQRLLYPVLIMQSKIVLQANLKASFGWPGLDGTWRILSGVTPLALNKFQYCSSVAGLDGVLQAIEPLSVDCRHFEVEIVGCGENSVIGMGVSSIITTPIAGLHGAHPVILYHSNGSVKSNSTGLSRNAVPYNLGDIVGCTVHFSTLTEELTAMEFFKNGVQICRCTGEELVTTPSSLYPVVQLSSEHDIIKIKQIGQRSSSPVIMDQSPFVLNWTRFSEHLQSNRQTIVCLESSGKPNLAQVSQPFSAGNDALDNVGEFSYFEAELLKSEDQVTVGVAMENHPLDSPVGCHGVSIGYSCLSGAIAISVDVVKSKAHQSNHLFGPPAHSGDVIGVGLQNRPSSTNENVKDAKIYFTKNGIYIGHTTLSLPVNTDLFPTVALGIKGEAVKLDISCLPFREPNAFKPWQSLTRIEASMLNNQHYLKHNHMDQLCGGLAIANTAFSDSCAYFEVELKYCGKLSRVAIGTVPSLYPLDKYPGRAKHSFGYQSNGKVFKEHSTGSLIGPCRISKGDLMGCGVNSDPKKGFCFVYFTLNRVQMVRFKVPLPSEDLHPAVGLFFDDEVEVQFYARGSLPEIQVPPPVSLRGTHHVSYLEQVISYSGDPAAQKNRKIGVVQFNTPSVDGQFVLNVTIRRMLPQDTVLVGLAEPDYPNSVFIGQLPSSIGYNVTTGIISASLDSKREVRTHPCAEMDVIGVVVMEGNPSCVIYTLNGQPICNIPCSREEVASLLPVINIISEYNSTILCCYWSPWQHGVYNDLNC